MCREIPFFSLLFTSRASKICRCPPSFWCKQRLQDAYGIGRKPES
ncbi:hypothetical protein F8388_017673 [Cannabis sativa]|uniref:Uncharacterized protein n=1 Tax=Cannabis sativa TaxID=3483 RepID=A0A7J6HIT2_CANSA|nr:hypothetical protein F8388_017673 [Cannabis sativa]